MYLSNLLFRTTGLMTKGCIKRKASQIGEAVAEVVACDGNNKGKAIQQVFQNVIGRRAKSIKTVSDKDEFVSLFQKNSHVSQKTAEDFYESSLSAVIPRNAGDSVILNIRANELPLDDLANIASHEAEHALYEAFSINSAIGRLLLKIPILRDWIIKKALIRQDEFEQKGTVLQTILINNIGKCGATGYSKQVNTIEGLLAQCECKSLKSLHSRIRAYLYGSGVLTIGKNKENKAFLESIISTLEDEERAYSIGGRTQHVYDELMGTAKNTASSSELCAKLYQEAVKVLKKEYKHINRNIRRTRLGLKVDYSTEEKLADAAKIEMIFLKIVDECSKLGKTFSLKELWKNHATLLKQFKSIGEKARAERRSDFTEEEWKKLAEITIQTLS